MPDAEDRNRIRFNDFSFLRLRRTFPGFGKPLIGPRNGYAARLPRRSRSGAGVAPGFESVRRSGFLCPDPGCRPGRPLVSLCLKFS